MNRVFATLVIAVLAGALTLWGLVYMPELAFAAYLVALIYWLTLAVGSLLLLTFGLAVRARWFVVLRRLCELVVASLPALAALFVPVLVGMHELYPWAGARGGYAVPSYLVAYENPVAFCVRTAAYFAVFLFVGERLVRWSFASDAAPAAELYRRQQRLAAGGIPAIGLALTFAAFDWLMSLPPHWSTTMFGVYVFAGAFLSGLALLVLLAFFSQSADELRQAVQPSHYYALGRLLLAFVIFWAYIAYSQFFLTWMADLPEEITWYQNRLDGAWMGLSVFLLVGHFIAPFLLLLLRSIKKRPRQLAALAAWILAVHYLDVYWLVMPTVRPRGVYVHWLDAAAFVAVGSISALFALWRSNKRPLLVVHDPKLQASLRYSRP